MLKKRKIFKELLKDKRTILVPGAYDGLSAKVIDSLGFDAVYLTGYGMEASRLGMPDIGLASMAEVVDQARNMNEAVSIPVVCDSDTGYGGLINVYRTVRSFEKAGIAAIHLEDQSFPKKCGGLPGRELISAGEMVGKIKSALDAREDDDFVIIARTDARGASGGSFDEAKRRLHAYLDAGADLTLVAERYPIEELRELAKSLDNTLVICAGIAGWEEYNLPFSEYEEWGVKLVIHPLLGLYAAEKALINVHKELKREKYISEAKLAEFCCGFDEFNELISLKFWTNLEEKYGPKE